MTDTLLLIAKNWPEPNSTAAGRRTLDLLQSLATQNYRIHVACAAEPTPFQADLTELGITTHTIQVNDSNVDDWLAQLAPDLVIFDRYVMEEQFGWRVRQAAPNAMTLLDTSDLHCLRTGREQAIKTGSELDLFNDIALRELTSIARCDLTLMISEFEVHLLQQQFGIPSQLLSYLPFLIDEHSFCPGGRYEQRQHLIMLGGFKHEPNRDATRWLKQEIWPALRTQLPAGVEMHVYGAYADHAMNQLNNPKEKFYVKGRVEDALKTLGQYRVNLAPLRFGAGQKGKILEGWLTHTPTITTAVGAESMASAEALGYEPSQHSADFVAQVVRAYTQQDVWQDLQRRGANILNTRFQRDAHARRFTEQVAEIRHNLAAHRHRNFWGRLLWQNQFRASEFMSRWIEAKNYNKAGNSATD